MFGNVTNISAIKCLCVCVCELITSESSIVTLIEIAAISFKLKEVKWKGQLCYTEILIHIEFLQFTFQISHSESNI